MHGKSWLGADPFMVGNMCELGPHKSAK
jgi:hypothetical protein